MTGSVAEQRTAVLKKLRDMLARQRDKLQSYLDLLELEHDAIADGDVERLQAQVELERGVIAEIQTIVRVVRPLEDLYQAAYPEREDTVPALQAALAKLGTQVKERNARNRAALKEKMEDLRREIAGLRAWPRGDSPLAAAPASLVDITT